tara:strand:+ start:116 stop:406 length:291 start_codon:yes stop_codon:yes gene_type:complete
MAKRKTKKDNGDSVKPKKFRKRPKNFKKMRDNEEVSNYIINHRRHGCYEVVLKTGEKMLYLTNFKNKKAAEKFVEAHKLDQVIIDPETCIPTPDFK